MAQEEGRGGVMQGKPMPELRRAAWGYKTLQRVTVAIRSQIDLGRVLDGLVADTARFLDLALCSIARWDETGRSLRFTTEYRRDPSHARRTTLMGKGFEPAADPAAGEFETTLFKEHMSVITSPQAGAASAMPEFLSALEESACIVTPMIGEGRLVGLLVAARPRELPGWTDEEVEFLRAAADIAAVSIQHAALRSHLRVISAAAAEINSRLSVQGLLRRLTEAAMSVTQSSAGLAGIREGEEMVCHEICRQGVWSAWEARFARDQGLAGWVWTNRAPCVANEAGTDSRALPELVARYGVRSALTLPIVDRDGEVLGFFELHNKAAGIPYGEEDVHLASSLAHHAALALDAHRR